VDGWVYTATVIDLYSRTVVGHAVADHRADQPDHRRSRRRISPEYSPRSSMSACL